MKFSALALLFPLAANACPANTEPYYYPYELVRPPNFWIEGVVPILHGNTIQGYETPIAVFQTMIVDQLMWECVAAYDDEAVSVIDFERPPFVGPENHHDSEARALCMVHAINKVLDGGLVPDAAPMWVDYVDSLCLDSTVPSDDDALAAVQDDGMDTPYAIGHNIGRYFLDKMRNSGWNFDGSLNKFGEECTGVCPIYGDNGPKPYVPVVSPFEVKKPKKKKHRKRYQPLIEDNEKGFVFAQAHVTPHIGYNVELEIVREPIFCANEFSDAVVRGLDDPKYDYKEEAEEAIEQVRLTGESDVRKIAVEFFDNKINLAGGLIMRLRSDFLLSLEEQLMYHVGYTTIEHDSVVLAWREKVEHDLIRPTTVVQRMGDKTINSYRGPFMGTGDMSARDWHPYIRTMPHAEYPSGSACLCTAVAEYVDAYMADQHGNNTYPTIWEFAAGSSETEPGVVPAKALTLSFATMTELRDMCGKSRLWGGMHFTKSVQDSYQLCKGLGAKAYNDWARQLLPNNDLDSLFDDAEKFAK
uniref:Vanadium-dependent haloperoxidase NapH1-like second helical-bundle domain-containing protein n=1 Tax=Trieres chinensis TaxID=1514140 RepID=A0A7S1ZRM1_TRICV